jgi:hypothetical protein
VAAAIAVAGAVAGSARATFDAFACCIGGEWLVRWRGLEERARPRPNSAISTLLRRRSHPHRIPGAALAPLLPTAVALLALAPGAALASSSVVSYHGVRVTVPAGWPVFHLSTGSSVCVRFDRHAVYLGTPGTDQICPSQPAGRTEAILIAPEGSAPAAAAARGALTPTSVSDAGDSMLRLVKRSRHVVITATWNHRPQTIRRALGLSSLGAAAAATNGHAPKKAVIVKSAAKRRAHATVALTPAATPGEVYSGLGFDACSVPSTSTLAAWSASPYRALGIYIGGADMACTQSNLNASWVSLESAAGWHMIPTYVGLQAPTTGCTSCTKFSAATATTAGTAAAQDAVAQAQAIGIGTGNPIYYDMENYARSTSSTSAVLAFLEAWTDQLHLGGYLSGVYSSGSSGVTDLVAAAGTGYTEPDDLWIADWDDHATTVDAYVPASDWSSNQRLRQYEGANNETYGGVEINVDNDDLDAATAAYGSATTLTAVASAPTISARPQADGDVALTPSWSGEPGVVQWKFLGGPSATAMTTVAAVPSTTSFPLITPDAYAFYEVEAISATGQLIGTAQPIQTPSNLAIFGNSIFATTKGTIGVAVRCVNVTPCEVQGAIFEGSKRLTHIIGQSVPGTGVVNFPLTAGVERALHGVPEQPVRIDLSTSTGRKATRKLELYPFRIHGPAPVREIESSSTLRIQSKTEFVSHGFVGGVLATCTARTQCTLTTQVTTRAGVLISGVRSQVLGSGQTGYLTFRLTNNGHRLLQADPDNQFAARVQITSTPAVISMSGGAALGATATTTARARVSLVSYR